MVNELERQLLIIIASVGLCIIYSQVWIALRKVKK